MFGKREIRRLKGKLLGVETCLMYEETAVTSLRIKFRAAKRREVEMQTEIEDLRAEVERLTPKKLYRIRIDQRDEMSHIIYCHLWECCGDNVTCWLDEQVVASFERVRSVVDMDSQKKEAK